MIALFAPVAAQMENDMLDALFSPSDSKLRFRSIVDSADGGLHAVSLPSWSRKWMQLKVELVTR